MAGFLSEDEVAKYLDDKFGKGKWRFTSGYRSQGSEDRLRGEGAGTVPEGKISAHSKGTYEAPGAEDIVVDGKSADEVKGALKDGPFTKVIAEGREGPEGPHIHVEPAPPLPAGYALVDDPAVSTPAATPALPAGYTLVPDAPPPAARTSPLAAARAAEGVKEMTAPEHPHLAQFGSGIAEGAVGTPQMARDVAMPSPVGMLQSAGAASDQIAGLIHSAMGGQPPEKTQGPRGNPYAGADTLGDLEPHLAAPPGNWLDATLRFAGGLVGGALWGGPAADTEGIAARAAKSKAVAEASVGAARPVGNALAAMTTTPAPEYAANAARLKSERVYLTPGMERGGQARALEEAAKSDPARAQAVIEAENHSIDTFNRAAYRRVLSPLGETVLDDAPVGRAGIKALKAREDAAYAEVKPHLRGRMDPQLQSDFKQAKQGLTPAQQEVVDTKLGQYVWPRFQHGQIDGATYKTIESDLTTLAKGYKGSSQQYEREIGQAIEKSLDAIQDNAGRYTDPKWKARLQAVNRSYALFARIRDAAQSDLDSGGRFTPREIMAAVRRGDKGVGHGSFAQGDALLQDFAEPAMDVLPSKLPDSGTAYRTNATRSGVLGPVVRSIPVAGPVLDAGANRVTNALARRHLMGLRRPSAVTKNYLREAQMREASSRYGTASAAGGTQTPSPSEGQ